MAKLKASNPTECGRLVVDAARHGDKLAALYADPKSYLQSAGVLRLNGSQLGNEDHIVPVVDGQEVTVFVIPSRQDVEDKLAEIDRLDLPCEEKEAEKERFYQDIGTYMFRRCD